MSIPPSKLWVGRVRTRTLQAARPHPSEVRDGQVVESLLVRTKAVEEEGVPPPPKAEANTPQDVNLQPEQGDQPPPKPKPKTPREPDPVQNPTQPVTGPNGRRPLPQPPKVGPSPLKEEASGVDWMKVREEIYKVTDKMSEAGSWGAVDLIYRMLNGFENMSPKEQRLAIRKVANRLKDDVEYYNERIQRIGSTNYPGGEEDKEAADAGAEVLLRIYSLLNPAEELDWRPNETIPEDYYAMSLKAMEKDYRVGVVCPHCGSTKTIGARTTEKNPDGRWRFANTLCNECNNGFGTKEDGTTTTLKDEPNTARKAMSAYQDNSGGALVPPPAVGKKVKTQEGGSLLKLVSDLHRHMGKYIADLHDYELTDLAHEFQQAAAGLHKRSTPDEASKIGQRFLSLVDHHFGDEDPDSKPISHVVRELQRMGPQQKAMPEDIPDPTQVEPQAPKPQQPVKQPAPKPKAPPAPKEQAVKTPPAPPPSSAPEPPKVKPSPLKEEAPMFGTDMGKLISRIVKTAEDLRYWGIGQDIRDDAYRLEHTIEVGDVKSAMGWLDDIAEQIDELVNRGRAIPDDKRTEWRKFAEELRQVIIDEWARRQGEIDWRPTETIPEDYYAMHLPGWRKAMPEDVSQPAPKPKKPTKPKPDVAPKEDKPVSVPDTPASVAPPPPKQQAPKQPAPKQSTPKRSHLGNKVPEPPKVAESPVSSPSHMEEASSKVMQSSMVLASVLTRVGLPATGKAINEYIRDIDRAEDDVEKKKALQSLASLIQHDVASNGVMRQLIDYTGEGERIENLASEILIAIYPLVADNDIDWRPSETIPEDYYAMSLPSWRKAVPDDLPGREPTPTPEKPPEPAPTPSSKPSVKPNPVQQAQAPPPQKGPGNPLPEPPKVKPRTFKSGGYEVDYDSMVKLMEKEGMRVVRDPPIGAIEAFSEELKDMAKKGTPYNNTNNALEGMSKSIEESLRKIQSDNPFDQHWGQQDIFREVQRFLRYWEEEKTQNVHYIFREDYPEQLAKLADLAGEIGVALGQWEGDIDWRPNETIPEDYYALGLPYALMRTKGIPARHRNRQARANKPPIPDPAQPAQSPPSRQRSHLGHGVPQPPQVRTSRGTSQQPVQEKPRPSNPEATSPPIPQEVPTSPPAPEHTGGWEGEMGHLSDVELDPNVSPVELEPSNRVAVRQRESEEERVPAEPRETPSNANQETPQRTGVLPDGTIGHQTPQQRAELKKHLETADWDYADPLGGGHANSAWLLNLKDGAKGVFKPGKGEDLNWLESIPNGRMYRREAAASLVAEFFGFDDLVPATGLRIIDSHGGHGSVQAFIEKKGKPANYGYNAGRYDGEEDLIRAAIFDYLIGNVDRHTGNWFLGTDERGDVKKLSLIDNGTSFPSVNNVDAMEGDLCNWAFFWRAASFLRYVIPSRIGAAWHGVWPELRKQLHDVAQIELPAIDMFERRAANIVNYTGRPFRDLPNPYWHGKTMEKFAQIGPRGA